MNRLEAAHKNLTFTGRRTKRQWLMQLCAAKASEAQARLKVESSGYVVERSRR